MNAFEAALYQKLTTTAALTTLLATATSVYAYLAPESAGYPLVVFNKQAGTEDNETPVRTRQLVYQVAAIVADPPTGVGKTMKDALAIDEQVDAALNGVLLTVTGWTTFRLRRESDVAFVEPTDAGKLYYHAGGLYRARLSA
jgi:Protein of unknown function (DUF3168)